MKLILDSEKCTGCKLCELACSASHQSVFNPGKSHIKISIVGEDGAEKKLKSCTLCLACMTNCPSEAIDFNNGWLTADAVKCTSCGLCIDICPQGVIYQNGNGKAVTPDFCKGSPVCIEWCPHQALGKLEDKI